MSDAIQSLPLRNSVITLKPPIHAPRELPTHTCNSVCAVRRPFPP